MRRELILLLREVRGNAAWDAVKWLFFKGLPMMVATVISAWAFAVAWIKDAPLLVLVLVGVLVFLAAVFICQYVQRQIARPSRGIPELTAFESPAPKTVEQASPRIF